MLCTSVDYVESDSDADEDTKFDMLSPCQEEPNDIHCLKSRDKGMYINMYVRMCQWKLIYCMYSQFSVYRMQVNVACCHNTYFEWLLVGTVIVYVLLLIHNIM